MSNSAPSPEVVIQGGAVLHVGLPDGIPIEDLRARKKDGRQLIWLLTKEDKEKFTPLHDEVVFNHVDDAQLRRLLHDEMPRWMGAEVLPPGERIAKITGIMTEVADLHQFNARSDTVLSKDNLPFQNSVRNYKWFEDGVSLTKLRGSGAGKPCVIIAAGPSLNSQWAQLREYRKKYPEIPFVVCGRSYRKAMMEEVLPQIVVEVEQYDWDADLFMFAPPPPQGCILAFPCTAAPRLAHVWPAHRMCLLNHNLAQAMGKQLGHESVDGGNSVLHYMVTLAGVMGSKDVYLAGVDFGYPKGMEEDTHANGTFHPWPGAVLNTEHAHQMGLELVANDGGKLMTSEAYKNFGTYLAVQVQRIKMGNPAWGIAPLPDFNVKTFSKRGLKVDGVEYMDIAEWK